MSDAIEARAETTARNWVEGATDPAEAVALARYLASADFARKAAELKNALIVKARAEHPDETYEQTAERLHVSVSSVNRAVSAHNRATRAPAPTPEEQ